MCGIAKDQEKQFGKIFLFVYYFAFVFVFLKKDLSRGKINHQFSVNNL